MFWFFQLGFEIIIRLDAEECNVNCAYGSDISLWYYRENLRDGRLHTLNGISNFRSVYFDIWYMYTICN